jgi:hypothetical protein
MTLGISVIEVNLLGTMTTCLAFQARGIQRGRSQFIFVHGSTHRLYVWDGALGEWHQLSTNILPHELRNVLVMAWASHRGTKKTR